MSEDLREQIEELMMLQRVDQTLGATLDFDSVLRLLMEWAIGRTEASAGMYLTLSPDGQGLVPLVAAGYPDGSVPFSAENPWRLDQGIVGQAAGSGQLEVVADVQTYPAHVSLIPKIVAEMAAPLTLRGSLIGVLLLQSDTPESFSEANIAFIGRLAARAAIALDHARLYREAESRADELASLYAASRLVSSSLERDTTLANAAQSMASVLRMSSAVICDYRAHVLQLVVSTAYRLPTARNAPDTMPAAGTILELDSLPELLTAVRGQRPAAFSRGDKMSRGLRAFMEQHHFQTVLIAPLTVIQTAANTFGEVIGAALVCEGRFERGFSFDELQLAEALASQIAAAIRQVRLYADVRELEAIKSDMIRMASHDLRNPLGNVMGYFELLMETLRGLVSEEMEGYAGYVRRSLNTMKVLLEDLLTLERIESERQASWSAVDVPRLVEDVVKGQQGAALLKGHNLTLRAENNNGARVFGSTTQIKQAITNLVGNAIKYTPDNGTIEARLYTADKRLIFEVQDNGYGISKDRQARLFQSFYRAHEPGTEHISGTGLGLSLVRTVVERHGGEVWVDSEVGTGSTFGFWMPLAAALKQLHTKKQTGQIRAESD